jgi:hypothetical protein
LGTGLKAAASPVLFEDIDPESPVVSQRRKSRVPGVLQNSSAVRRSDVVNHPVNRLGVKRGRFNLPYVTVFSPAVAYQRSDVSLMRGFHCKISSSTSVQTLLFQ